jgi:hypothetical protein
MTEGARFENPDAPETIGPDLVSSYQSQSLAEESEIGRNRLNMIEHDSSATFQPQEIESSERTQRKQTKKFRVR